MELLVKWFPNVVEKWDELVVSCGQTLYMVLVAGSIAFVFGLVFGIILTVTAPGRIMQNKLVYTVLDKIINLFRSVPFIILLAALIPLTRLVVGTSLGTKGVLLPLVFGTVPFFTRQIESALADVDTGVIEAAQSMGSGPWEIIWQVYLRESIPGLVRATTITIVSLIGLTAMAGTVGGGGLGDFAIRYGHQRFKPDITFVTVVIILGAISLVQFISNRIIQKTTH